MKTDLNQNELLDMALKLSLMQSKKQKEEKKKNDIIIDWRDFDFQNTEQVQQYKKEKKQEK